MSNRFNSLKKGISKVKNVSPKIKGNLNRKRNSSRNGKSRSAIEYIVPENSPLRKNSLDLDSDESYSSDYLDGLPEGVTYTRPADAYNDSRKGSNNLQEDFIDSSSDLNHSSNDYIYSDDDSSHSNEDFNYSSNDLIDSKDYSDDLDLDGVDKRYAKYIFGDSLSNQNFKNPRDSNYREVFDNNGGLNSDLERKGNFHIDENYNGYDSLDFDNDLDNNDESYKDNFSLDENYSDFSLDDDLDSALDGNYSDFSSDGDLDSAYMGNPVFNGSGDYPKKGSGKPKGLKGRLVDFRTNLLGKEDRSKDRFGKIVFVLIFLVLSSSIFYFFVYQPFQDELNLERNSKLNELNALYCGPLEAHDNAYILKNQIESESDIGELKKIDVLMYATKDWRSYHKSKIVSSKDDFGRIMLVYGDDSKNIIMSVKDANEFVKDNDGKALSNVRFEKVDTAIVPVSISRLQATAGLISVGSIVDIYSLNDNYSYGYGQSDDSSDSDSSVPINESGDDSSLGDGGEGQDSDNGNASDSSAISGMSAEDDSGMSFGEDSGISQDSEPDVSGATVLAILRSKDSGVIDSSISRSNTLVDGNVTDPYENTSSYSNDVEELLKASVFNSYDDNRALESYLDSYGIKLSNYERMSNLADLDSDYLVLLEVPRSDVGFVINNMDNLILTIPTEFAPNWVIGELNETYYENIYSYDSNSSSFI